MAIRKYGNEPARTEVRAEDNDLETLASVRAQAGSPEAAQGHQYPCDLDDCLTCRRVRKQ